MEANSKAKHADKSALLTVAGTCRFEVGVNELVSGIEVEKTPI